MTKGAVGSSPVASSTLGSAASPSRTEGSAGGISTGLSCNCSTFVLDTLCFVFKVFCFVVRGLVSAFAVDAGEGAFVTNLWTGFLAGTRGLLFSAPLLTLAELVVLRGLSQTEPSAEAATAELAGLCRPSFGDLARVGAICKRTQVYFRMPCLLMKHCKICTGIGHAGNTLNILYKLLSPEILDMDLSKYGCIYTCFSVYTHSYLDKSMSSISERRE